MSNYPECQRLFMCSFRGFGLKAEDVSAYGRPRSISAAFNSRTREKPLVLRVKSKKRSYFFIPFYILHLRLNNRQQRLRFKMAGIDESIVNTSENGLETNTYLSVCVKNYGRSKTMREH